MPAQTMTGARVAIFINGQLFARAISFSYNSRTDFTPIRQLDSLEPAEFEPTATSISGSIGFVRTAGDGSIRGLGVSTNFENLSLLKGYSIALIDLQSNLVLLRTKGCVTKNENSSVSSRGIMSGTFDFEGYVWQNETG